VQEGWAVGDPSFGWPWWRRRSDFMPISTFPALAVLSSSWGEDLLCFLLSACRGGEGWKICSGDNGRARRQRRSSLIWCVARCQAVACSRRASSSSSVWGAFLRRLPMACSVVPSDPMAVGQPPLPSFAASLGWWRRLLCSKLSRPCRGRRWSGPDHVSRFLLGSSLHICRA
jgi:hypothetical protein